MFADSICWNGFERAMECRKIAGSFGTTAKKLSGTVDFLPDRQIFAEIRRFCCIGEDKGRSFDFVGSKERSQLRSG